MSPTLFAQLLARLGPWFGRLAKATPAIVPSLATKMRTAGAVVGDKTGDLVAFAVKNPMNATLFVTTLVSLGVAVKDLFDDPSDAAKPMASGDVDLLTNLDNVASSASYDDRNRAQLAIMASGKVSETMKTGLESNEVNMLAAREVLSWAVSHFGGVAAALRAHRLSQAFFEMPYEEVRVGYNNLRIG